jgi:hypothetical protein
VLDLKVEQFLSKNFARQSVSLSSLNRGPIERTSNLSHPFKERNSNSGIAEKTTKLLQCLKEHFLKLWSICPFQLVKKTICYRKTSEILDTSTQTVHPRDIDPNACISHPNQPPECVDRKKNLLHSRQSNTPILE